MTSFLEGLWLWVIYTLGAMLYLIIFLILLCSPVVLLYGVVHVLARLFVRVRDTDGKWDDSGSGGAGDEDGRAGGGSPLRDPRVGVQVERARETRRKDGRGGGKDREGRADARADPGDGAGAVP